MTSQVEALVTDILNTYVAVMLRIRGSNLLHTEELTSGKTKDDFCTYCQNISNQLQWLSLTISRPQSHKSIKVPLINYFHSSIINIFNQFWGLQVSHSTLQWGQIIVRVYFLTFQLDFTHSVFQNHNCPFVSKLNTHNLQHTITIS